MRALAVLLLAATLVSCAPALSPEQSREAYEDDLARFIRESVTDRLQPKIAENYRRQVSILLQSEPSVPPEAFRIADEEIDRLLDRKIDDLVKGFVPIYAKHFDHAEIRQLLAFYDSDIGQKSLAVSEEIGNEGSAVFQQWSEEFGQLLAERLETRMAEAGISF